MIDHGAPSAMSLARRAMFRVRSLCAHIDVEARRPEPRAKELAQLTKQLDAAALEAQFAVNEVGRE